MLTGPTAGSSLGIVAWHGGTDTGTGTGTGAAGSVIAAVLRTGVVRDYSICSLMHSIFSVALYSGLSVLQCVYPLWRVELLT